MEKSKHLLGHLELDCKGGMCTCMRACARTHTYAHRRPGEGRRPAFSDGNENIDRKMESSTEAREWCAREGHHFQSLTLLMAVLTFLFPRLWKEMIERTHLLH